MTAAPRIILHNDNTDMLERMRAKAVPEAVVKTCQNYSGLPDLIEGFDPESNQFRSVPLEDLIDRKLARLPAAAKSLLETISVAGQSAECAAGPEFH